MANRSYKVKRTSVLLVMLVSLGGCAGMGQSDAQRSSTLADIKAKLGLGRCDMALAEDVLSMRRPELEQEAAYLCLQKGELNVVDRLLDGFHKRYPDAPHADYSSYLAALSLFTRFEASLDDEPRRLATGRAAHAALVGFVRKYPESQYRGEVAPRLQQILEGMALAEFELAREAADAGDPASAEARMRYVVSGYPRTEAADNARAWLELLPE
jgi:outer membrane protein assembly factor BamD (BamD/ComL family)